MLLLGSKGRNWEVIYREIITRTRANKTLRSEKSQGKTGIELHCSGYQYLGAGTHLKKRLKRGDPGINRLDKLAKQHDIDYGSAKNLVDKWKADQKMIKAIDCLPGPGVKPWQKGLSRESFKPRKHSSCKHWVEGVFFPKNNTSIKAPYCIFILHHNITAERFPGTSMLRTRDAKGYPP